ncbi:glycosyltransferase family 4 protein [Saccharothrix variisporea]|uniref:Glycosyltransferase involved in cell wall biosynthesis n=1 Tax=Saccharothrix variisporea TaxID=543527 RepID=A0A495XIP4_9PSEU|nr:glycosyltransferase family 4 protein [Saccharothrix variisporea]RKT71468.1 glycosyltransferase involved in cell wall biosynthesis [Saccharothrix variisporea]
MTAYVDMPAGPVGHRFELRGWVTDVVSLGEVSVHIAGRRAEVREDEYPGAPRGAVGWVALTAHAVPNGPQPVSVFGPGGELLTSDVVVVGPAGDGPLHLGSLDGPEADSTVEGDLVLVTGWSLLDSRAPSRIEVFVEGSGVTRARSRLPRADVAGAFPDFADAGVCGFEARVPVEVPPGAERRVSVRVRVSTHGVGEWTSPVRFVTVRNPDGAAEDDLLADRLEEQSTRLLTRVEARPDPKHVLVLTHSLAIGGGQLWLQELLTGLVKKHNWAATVVTPIDGALRDDCTALGVPVHLTSHYRIGDIASYEGHVSELALLAKASGAGVALVNTLGAFGAADAAKRAGLPTAWVVHESFELADFSFLNWGPAGLAPTVKRRWEHSLGAVDRLLFVADATKEMFARYSAPERCRTIRYGTPMVRFGGRVGEHRRREARERLGVPQDALLLLNVGVVEPRKGQAGLIAAVERIRPLFPELVLAVIGQHPTPFGLALDDLVERGGLTDSVRLVPIQRDPTPWFHAADFFVNSSDVESLPRSILEAVCCGLPVVASDVFGAREMIEDAVTGWLFEPNDVDALTVALLRAFETSADERREVAGRAFDKLRDWLDPTGYADEYSEVLTDLANQGMRS